MKKCKIQKTFSNSRILVRAEKIILTLDTVQKLYHKFASDHQILQHNYVAELNLLKRNKNLPLAFPDDENYNKSKIRLQNWNPNKIKKNRYDEYYKINEFMKDSSQFR